MKRILVAHQKTILLMGLCVLGFMNMAAEGCSEAASRQLKMEVEIGRIDAHAVKMPSGEVLDFPYVANTLFQASMLNSAYFNVANPLPSTGKLTLNRTTQLQSGYSANDRSMLSKFGLLRSGGEFRVQAVSPDVACLMSAPQAVIKGDIISFALTWGVGIGVGYGQGGIPLPTGGTIGGGIDFSSSELQMAMRADEPLSGRTDVITDTVTSKSDIKLHIDLGVGIPLGLDFFFKEPITNVVKAAYSKAQNQIVQDYIKKRSTKGTWNEIWNARVIEDKEIANNDTHIAFRAGTRSNIKIGDTFDVISMRYQWKGVPCQSALDYQIPASNVPLANIKIIAVGDIVSVGEVLASPNTKPISAGDIVRLVQLVENQKKN